MGFLKSNWKKIALAVKILAVAFTLFFAITTVASTIMLNNKGAINQFFDIQTSVPVKPDENEEEGDTEYYKSSAKSVKETKEKGKELIEDVMEEGAVLLKNDNGALPLKRDAHISLYSVSSLDPVFAGTGSSGTSNYSDFQGTNESYKNYQNIGVVDFKTAFESVKGKNIKVNSDLWKWYENNYNTYKRKKSGAWGAYFTIGDASWNNIPSSAKNIADYGDAAIFVVSRRSGEGRDMPSYYGDEMWNNKTDMTNGNYLALSPNEISVLKGLKAEKAANRLTNIIVLINSANPVQCDFADDPDLGIDAVMWCGTLGQTGAQGVANIMAGNVTPSGRLSDTFWKYHYKNPVNANFAMDMYHMGDWGESVPETWLKRAKATSSEASWKNNMITNSRSTVYAEGIYVGYRYTETRYEDYLAGYTENYDYYDVVSYPFGYGLSYTTFKYSDFTMTRTAKSGNMKDAEYTFTVKVTNTGETYSGKETVQLYLQKPFTDYDRLKEIEKSSVELVAFGKTRELAPGESQILTLKAKEKELACYDAKGEKTYILEQGDYYFTVGKDAHDAANNIIKYKKDDGTPYLEDPVANGNSGLGDKSLVKVQNIKNDNFTVYSTSTYAMERGIKSDATKITNQFEAADILYYDGATKDFAYITRTDWDGTVKFGFTADGKATNDQVKVTVTDEMFRDRKEAMADPEPSSEGTYPAYGVNNSQDADGHLNLVDLRAYADDDDDVTNDVPIAYNDPLWDKLLDQLTWNETTKLLDYGWRMTYGIESIAKPETIDFNGSVGFVTTYFNKNKTGLAMATDDPDKDELICIYPCNGICASTFNKELMEDYGKQWGEDSLWGGRSGLYGMGVNLHRSPYGGRNFEYYSEDPFLMGTIASSTAKGASSKGLYCYLKHCVLNEQETYRIGGYCWLTEQTMREIYLKPFRIAIEDGYASCVMTAEPAIGVQWSGQQGFVKSVLRDEFGMTGIAVSDYRRDIDGNFLKALLAGSDLPDGEPGVDGATPMFTNISSTEGYAELAQCLRESAHRILYTVVRSNAMNGYSSGTRVMIITPAWVIALNAVTIVMTVLFALSAAALVGVLATETVFAFIKPKSGGATDGNRRETPLHGDNGK